MLAGTNIMKKEIADYIKILLQKGEPLTDAQARAIAYWEFADFQGNVGGPDKEECLAINKILGELNDEMPALV